MFTRQVSDPASLAISGARLSQPQKGKSVKKRLSIPTRASYWDVSAAETAVLRALKNAALVGFQDFLRRIFSAGI